MQYIAPIQICKANYKQKLDLINTYKHCLFSCWCLNLDNIVELEQLSNTIVMQNSVDALPEKEEILCENFLFKHIVMLLGLYSNIAVLSSNVKLVSNKPITILSPNNFIIKKSESTYVFFKKFEQYFIKTVGVYESSSKTLEELFEAFDFKYFKSLT